MANSGYCSAPAAIVHKSDTPPRRHYIITSAFLTRVCVCVLSRGAGRMIYRTQTMYGNREDDAHTARHPLGRRSVKIVRNRRRARLGFGSPVAVRRGQNTRFIEKETVPSVRTVQTYRRGLRIIRFFFSHPHLLFIKCMSHVGTFSLSGNLLRRGLNMKLVNFVNFFR